MTPRKPHSPSAASHSIHSHSHTHLIHSHSHSHSSALSTPRSASSLSIGVDRQRVRRLEEVTSELDRVSRLSESLPAQRELAQTQLEVQRLQRSSCLLVQSQRELLERIERHERSTFRRYLTLNREHKVAALRRALSERMLECSRVDDELRRLERQSDTLLSQQQLQLRTTRPPSDVGSDRDRESDSDVDVAVQLALLEQERQELLRDLVHATVVGLPDVSQLHTRLEVYASERRASESVHKQVERCAALYRQALQLLQAALSTILAPEYSGSIKEFITGPYLLAVEAGHLVESAAFAIQPEARRRYRDFAPDVVRVRPPKFPQAVVDFAKRARGNFDRRQALSVEASRRLHAAENVVAVLHRLVVEKLERLYKWKDEVEQDLARATESHQRIETRLQEHMSVLARSVSV
ncbi:hypothetical protein PINS_up007820 [Pythium insidiosum]|nr:hypothetical protein PINS_up007820 [Pythium insidiosum]